MLFGYRCYVMDKKRPFSVIFNDIFIFLLMLILSTNNIGFSFQPEFAEPILNLTVPIGRDATFKCLVTHLGGYRVGWVKADTKAIQAIHDHVITHNPRVSVSHDDYTTWKLHIRNVQEEDRGDYMCQINTDPMKSQMGYLDVVTPPDFVEDETSGDVMLPEGGTAKLTCRARGYPVPSVVWRREDGQDMILKEPNGIKNKVTAYEGEILKLSKVTRSEMGAYLCIASNGVRPSISKRIMVNVHFHPVIQVPNQLVGAPLGTDVKLECIIEASPKSINYWIRDTGDMIVASNKYDVQTSMKSLFEAKMSVIIRNFHADDIGSYHCVAKNSLGEMESTIRLYEIPGPTKQIFPSRFDEEDYNEQYGSAETGDLDPDNDLSLNRVTERDKYKINWNSNSNNNNNNNNIISQILSVSTTTTTLEPTLEQTSIVTVAGAGAGGGNRRMNNKLGNHHQHSSHGNSNMAGVGSSSTISFHNNIINNHNNNNKQHMPITNDMTTQRMPFLTDGTSSSTTSINRLFYQTMYFICLVIILLTF